MLSHKSPVATRISRSRSVSVKAAAAPVSIDIYVKSSRSQSMRGALSLMDGRERRSHLISLLLSLAAFYQGRRKERSDSRH